MYKLVGYRHIKGNKNGRDYDFMLLFCLRDNFNVIGMESITVNCNTADFENSGIQIGDEFDFAEREVNGRISVKRFL